MLRRKKRIPYDPPGARKKRKRREWRRADQIFLTRRMLLMKGAIVAGFTALTARLGYLQIIKGAHYTAKTRDYTRQWVSIKPPRGLIFDRAGRPLAENRRVWEVRVVPAHLPERNTPEYKRVRSALITALRLPEVLVVDPDSIPRGSEDTVYRRLARLFGVTEEPKIQQFVDSIKQEARWNYLVPIDTFDADQAPMFRAVAQELPGVEVINRFDFLVRNTAVRDRPIVVKRDVSRETAMMLAANLLDLPGVQLDDSALVRSYPAGESVSHILGYVGGVNEDELKNPENQTAAGHPIYELDDIIGKNGLELTMEKLLRGNKGGRYIEMDGLGFERNVLFETPAVPGRNLRLSIDVELQALATKALEDGIRFSNEDRVAKDAYYGRPPREYHASGGAVVVLDPRTGEVLALASYPTYDNQLFVDGISSRKFKEYRDDPRQPLVNKAVAGHYPPGSTLKIFVALAGLREKVIEASTTFTCTGGIWVPFTFNKAQGERYLCWQHDPVGHGTLNLLEALERSCDVYFYNVGTPRQKPEGDVDYLHYRDLYWTTGQIGDVHYFRGLGIKNLHKHLRRRFWFGEQTGIELPVEAPGLVPDPEWKAANYQGEGWSAGDTINASIGQGYFLASPLQLAVNTAAIANGGTIWQPRLVREIVDSHGQTLQKFERKMLRRIKIDKEHLRIVREGMWRVVNSPDGTAHHHVDISTGEVVSKWPLTNPPGEEPIIIAGKTGTAEFGPKNEKGIAEESHAWFTCYAPFESPEVVVSVFVENGGEGSSYAVPIADRVLRAYFEITGKRPRGLVLPEDGLRVGQPAASPAASPSPEQAEPTRTPEATSPPIIGDGTQGGG